MSFNWTTKFFVAAWLDDCLSLRRRLFYSPTEWIHSPMCLDGTQAQPQTGCHCQARQNNQIIVNTLWKNIQSVCRGIKFLYSLTVTFLALTAKNVQIRTLLRTFNVYFPVSGFIQTGSNHNNLLMSNVRKGDTQAYIEAGKERKTKEKQEKGKNEWGRQRERQRGAGPSSSFAHTYSIHFSITPLPPCKWQLSVSRWGEKKAY